MADQVAIRAPRNRWAEGSGFTATADFRTRSSRSADTPTTVHYRVDCLKTSTVLADWTSVSTASQVSISITPTHNAIQDDSNRFERKQLIVAADKDLTTQSLGFFKWTVENLQGVT